MLRKSALPASTKRSSPTYHSSIIPVIPTYLAKPRVALPSYLPPTTSDDLFGPAAKNKKAKKKRSPTRTARLRKSTLTIVRNTCTVTFLQPKTPPKEQSVSPHHLGTNDRTNASTAGRQEKNSGSREHQQLASDTQRIGPRPISSRAASQSPAGCLTCDLSRPRPGPGLSRYSYTATVHLYMSTSIRTRTLQASHTHARSGRGKQRTAGREKTSEAATCSSKGRTRIYSVYTHTPERGKYLWMHDIESVAVGAQQVTSSHPPIACQDIASHLPSPSPSRPSSSLPFECRVRDRVGLWDTQP